MTTGETIDSGEVLIITYAGEHTIDNLDSAAGTTIPTEDEVEVALADGSRLRGFVSYVLPPERARLVDFLNQNDRFFRLAEPGGVALVSRAHVASVTLIPR